ncbi:MAG: hypothetical protein KDA37_14245 [Planctomycetales bacterium]|nr:hypothetical protein [Planctomycetales bacterium]
MPLPPPYDFDEDLRGLTAVQLKRALRGAAFLQGALVSIRAGSAADKVAARVLNKVEAIQSEIVEKLKQNRPEKRG